MTEDRKREVVDIEPFEPKSPDLDGRDSSMDPERMTLPDIVNAEVSRPESPGETVDGLDETEEEIRHQAEDVSVDEPGRF